MVRKLVLPLVAVFSLAAIPGNAEARSVMPSGLSYADRMAALDGMTAHERTMLKERFTSKRYVVVGFARTVQSFDVKSGKPVGAAQTLAIGQAAPASVNGITNLSLTISLTYDRESPCCNWDIYDTFDWTGKPPNNGSGKDQIASGWNNNLTLRSDSAGAWGYYTNGAHISLNLQDVVPGAGFNFEFSECNAAYCNSYADWGYEIGTIFRTSRGNQGTNLIFKYFHTYASITYSLSISGT